MFLLNCIDERRYKFHYISSFVQLNSKDTAKVQELYKLHPSLDTVLLFNEDSIRPVASVSMSDIPTQTLNNVIQSNQYLALPRLSSQELLEGNIHGTGFCLNKMTKKKKHFL